ncbi:MAG: hypothetical protein IJX88_06095 [Clostridia bacterium]|nr:hypothetical protein [Clostridia bacterium]
MKRKKERRKEELDTETTFADMNVEGFSWYNPNKKKGAKPIGPVTKKEYWAMVKGAFAAMLPVILCVVAVSLLVFIFAMLWLR